MTSSWFLVSPRREFRGVYPIPRVKTVCSLVGLTTSRSWDHLGVVMCLGTQTHAQRLKSTNRFHVTPI